MFKPFKHFIHTKQFITPKFRPLSCSPGDIIALFRECISINAPMARFVVEHNGMRHRLGMDADYSSGEWSDIEFYLDDERFSTLDEFCEKCSIDGDLFAEMDMISVLEDEDAGDPRNNVMLSSREIKRGRKK